MFLPHISTWGLWLKGNSCEYSSHFSNKAAQCCASAAARCLWKSLDAVWSRKTPADGIWGAQIHTNTSPMRTRILPQLAPSCIFRYSCLHVSQVSTEGHVSNWLLNNKVAAVNQPITNKCYLVFHCALSVLLFWGLALSFCSFELPECSNSELCSLKDHTGVFILCTIIQKVYWSFLDWQTLCHFPGFQWCPFCSVQCDSQQAETWNLPETFLHRSRCAVKKKMKTHLRSELSTCPPPQLCLKIVQFQWNIN